MQLFRHSILFMCCVSIMFHSKKSPVEIMVSLAVAKVDLVREKLTVSYTPVAPLTNYLIYKIYSLQYKLFLSSHINTMSELNTSSSSYLDPPILRNWLVTKVDRSNQCSLGICDLILMRNVPLLFFLHSSFTGNVDRHRIFF